MSLEETIVAVLPWCGGRQHSCIGKLFSLFFVSRPPFIYRRLQVHPSVGPKDAERRAPLGCRATMRRGLIVAPNEEGWGVLFWNRGHLGPTCHLPACVPSQKEMSWWNCGRQCAFRLRKTWLWHVSMQTGNTLMALKLCIYAHNQNWYRVSGASRNTALISVVQWVFFAEEPKCLQVI